MKWLALALVLGVTVVFFWTSLRSGAHADACAFALEKAIGSRDRLYVERAVRSPPIRESLMAANHVEVGFVRPMSSDWARVGMFVRATATSTSMRPVMLWVGTKSDDECTFYPDHEAGAFESGS